MIETPPPRIPIPGAGAVCFRGDAVLLIKRGRPPLEGRWSIPGGRIEWGETAAHAALRELNEETGVRAELTGLIDVIDALIPGAPGETAAHYLIVDYAARWIAGEPIAGDDAIEARFFAPEELAALNLTADAQRVIAAARARLSGGAA